MSTVKNRFLRSLMAVVLMASSVSGESSPFTGTFKGTGRACSGGLYVRSQTISWVTTFSRCQRVPYEAVERSEKGNQREFVFRLKAHKKMCAFNVLYLHHPNTPDMALDWEVIGYASVAQYEADKRNGFKTALPNSLSCPLFPQVPKP